MELSKQIDYMSSPTSHGKALKNDHDCSLPFIAVQIDLLCVTLRAQAVSGKVSGNAAGFSI